MIRWCENDEKLCSSATRRGVTIVEILVVFSVLFALASVFLPAVMNVRERARQVQCGSNLRQLGMAAENHEGLHGEFPVAAEVFPDEPLHFRSSPLSTLARLLPFLEQESLFGDIARVDYVFHTSNRLPSSDRNAAHLFKELPMFVCPSDGGSGKCSYRVCAGTSTGMHQTRGVDPPSAGLSGMGSSFGRLATNVIDGLSNTVFFSEKLTGDQDNSSYDARRDTITGIRGTTTPPFRGPEDARRDCRVPLSAVKTHASFGGATWLSRSYATTLYNHVLTPNAVVPDCSEGEAGTNLGAFTARSNHAGGVNIQMADGSGRFVSEDVDLVIWRAMATINGDETVGNY